MNKVQAFKILLVGALVCGLISCQSKQPASKDAPASGTSFPRAKTLYLGGDQWGEPNTFNPLCDWPAWPIRGKDNIMYEPLMTFNSLTGEMEPLLAHTLQKSPDTISVILDSRAKWSDGTPVTAEDVIFTYEIGKTHKSAPTAYVWDLISAITSQKVADTVTQGKTQAEKIVLVVNKKERNNPLSVLDQLQAIRIIPKHVFEPMLAAANNDLSAFQKEKLDKNPVVSGPYNLDSYSGEKIVLKRRDDYWGNDAIRGGRKPAPEYYIHPIFKSNDHFSIALSQGNLDISSTFIPRIWMKAKNKVGTWHKKEPYFVPGCIPMLLINCTHYPLTDKTFRRAMAHAVNYREIKDLAVSGYTPELKPGLILPFGMEKQYYAEEDAKQYGAVFDTAQARKLLKDAGYTSTFDKDGNLVEMKDAKGAKVPTLLITSPAGWSDWEAMVRIAVKSMRAVGIDVREGFVDASLYWQALPFGNFDLIMHKPDPEAAPSKPWSRFDMLMSSRNWKPQGERMNENQGRYNNPKGREYNKAVDSLLKAIPRITDDPERVSAIRRLNVLFMQDQVTLPLAYLPEQFYQFSTQNWTNFPTEDNPYAPPQPPFYGAGIKMLWEIKPAK
ncbi:MAG: ABC transporter substrate-binding protein [Chitinispirillaceae bacterium]|nr:ABC transporter substrate-binding protein [Chitinispirillaceae bacterium]